MTWLPQLRSPSDTSLWSLASASCVSGGTYPHTYRGGDPARRGRAAGRDEDQT